MMRRVDRATRSGDLGASLVFVLVAVSVLALAVGSLTSALNGGFLSNRALSAAQQSGDTDGRALTQQSLLLAAAATKSSNAADPKQSKGKCFSVSADGTRGASYIDYPLGSATPKLRVFCTPYNANVTDSILIPTNSQPDITSGLALQEQMYLCGSGNYYTQGSVAAKTGIKLFSDTGCATAALSTCPQATSTTQFQSLTTGSVACPALYAYDALPGDGTVSTAACVPTYSRLIWAEGGGTRSAAISSIKTTSGTATITVTTSAAHNLGVGSPVTLTSLTGSLAAYDGTGGAVATVPSTTTFTMVSTVTAASTATLTASGSPVATTTSLADCANSAVDLTNDLTTPSALPTSTISAGASLVDLASSTSSGSGATSCTTSGTATLNPGVYDDTPGTATTLGADATQVSTFLQKLGAGTALCAQQTGALSAASTSLATTLSVSERAGFIPGDTLTVGSSSFTVANGYVPATGAGALTVTPIRGAGVALSSVKVGQVPTSLSVAATSAVTATGTTSNSSTAVSLSLGTASITRTTNASPNVAVTLGSFTPTAGQYITGTNIPAGTKVSSVTTWSASQTLKTDASASNGKISATGTATLDANIAIGSTVTCTTAPCFLTAGTTYTVTAMAADIKSFTISPAPTTANSTGASLTFSGGTKLVLDKNASASSTTAATATFYSGTNPAITTYAYVTGLNVTSGTYVSSTTGTAPMTAVTLSQSTSASGAGSATLTYSTTAVTGSIGGTLGTAGAVGDRIDFVGTGDSVVDGSTCLVSSLTTSNTALVINTIVATNASKDITVTTATAHGLAAGDTIALSGLGSTLDTLYKTSYTIKSTPSTTTFVVTTGTTGTGTTYSKGVSPMGANPKATPNKQGFTCVVQSDSSVSASTPTAANVLLLDTTSPVKTVAVTAATSLSGTVQLDSTGDADLNANDCLIAAAGTSFTCTLTTAPTVAFSGTIGLAYSKVAIATAAVVTASRTCIDVGGSWCNGPTYTALVISSLTSTTGSNDIKVTTATAHSLSVGDTVALSGLGGTLDALYRGTFTVKTVPTTTTFTITTATTGTSTGVLSGLGANPKATPAGKVITTITLNPGEYYFALASDWTVSSSAVTVKAGLMATPVTLADGSTSSCVSSYSASKDGFTSDQQAAINAQGVSLIFGGSNGADTGLSWTAGNVTICPKAVEVDAHPTDRPVAIYGPGPNPANPTNPSGDLTGTVSAPAYYAAYFTSGSTETISGRNTCTVSTASATALTISKITTVSGSYDITVTTSAAHGLAVGNTVTLSGLGSTNDALYKGTFDVKTVGSTTTFVVTTSTSAASTGSLSLGRSPKATPGNGSAALGACEILYVPSSRSSDDGTSLLLLGGIFAPSSRVTLTLNFTNDDAVTLYGMVLNSLRVSATAIPAGTSTCTGTRKSGCRQGGKTGKKGTFFRFVSYPCTATYNGTGICTQTTAPDLIWSPPGQKISIFTGGRATVVSTAALAISSVSVSGSTATVTTSSAHGLSPGYRVAVSGVTPTGYAGSTINVASVPSTTAFTYTVASGLGTPVVSSGKVTWLSDSCPPRGTYPWVGCMTVKFATTTSTGSPSYAVVGPFLPPDCTDPTSGACWAILG